MAMCFSSSCLSAPVAASPHSAGLCRSGSAACPGELVARGRSEELPPEVFLGPLLVAGMGLVLSLARWGSARGAADARRL
eukprot:13039915-Alexandrium_andersonii.AAC.1